MTPPAETPLLPSEGLRVKPEGSQPSGSVKYRMVYAKLSDALCRGEVAPGTTLVEVTSGSTGAALAWAGRSLGHPVELHAHRSITPDKRSAIERSGATLVLHDPERPVGEILAEVVARAREGACWHLGQYDRASVVEAYRDLAAELLRQLRGEVPRVFLCPVGTGGLIQGIGARLREAFPGIRVVAVEPLPGVSIDGTRNTDLFHLGPLDPYDKGFPDEVVRVERPAARATLGGVVLGESATAALAVARRWPGAVLIAPD